MMTLMTLLACAPSLDLEEPLSPEPQASHPSSSSSEASGHSHSTLLELDAQASPRNLIVISIDTLRQDALGHYSDDADTPFLDALAAEALVLEDHRSCASWTLASMTCFFSGTGLLELGYEPESRLGTASGIPSDFAGLPQWLADAGYQTALVPTNAFVSDRVPLGNGFQDVLWPDDHSEPGTARAVVDLATDWLEDHPWSSDGPATYLHLHLLDAHHPYKPPEAYAEEVPDDLPLSLEELEDMDELERLLEPLSVSEQDQVIDYLRALYKAEIRSMDDELERLFDTLDEEGWLNDSLVLVFADHGEGFNEHGYLEHGDSLFGELTQVPAMIWAPGLPSQSWDGPTTHADLAPTLLSMLGEPEGPETTGYPVGSAPTDRVRFSLRAGKALTSQLAADLDNQVLHYKWTGELAQHDLVSDPLEQTNVYDHADPLSLHLWEAIEDAANEMVTWTDVNEPEPPIY